MFVAEPASLDAQWTAMNADATGAISFGGHAGSGLLNQIMSMVQTGQLSNMAAFVPTDCPTREKHAWLGDAMDVAEEAMYNFWLQPVYELFLDTVRSEQVVGGPADGNLPMNVPAGKQAGNPADISWTAAYPLIAHWLYLYYGDTSVVREHWEGMTRFMDGQKTQMQANPARHPGDPKDPRGVPDFWSCGDWCAIESRAVCTPNTGPPAAAANYVLALEAMVAMAQALNETADARRYAADLSGYRRVFDVTFFNSSLSSYAKTGLEVQTMSSVALGAGLVPAAKGPVVTEALMEDLAAREHHLTVGATGQKWLLRTLTAAGEAGHEAALAVAMQDTFPSWGYWIKTGATTCLESWTGVQDGSHPGNPTASINPPTHNHIFLCGKHSSVQRPALVACCRKRRQSQVSHQLQR